MVRRKDPNPRRDREREMDPAVIVRRVMPGFEEPVSARHTERGSKIKSLTRSLKEEPDLGKQKRILNELIEITDEDIRDIEENIFARVEGIIEEHQMDKTETTAFKAAIHFGAGNSLKTTKQARQGMQTRLAEVEQEIARQN